MLQPQRKRYVKWESFDFKIKHVLLSVCLKYHIYEYFIDKKSERGYKHYFWCKKSNLLFDREYVMYVTNFKAFYIVLNNLNNTS